MKEDMAYSILRLIAVVTVLVGAILVTMTIVGLIGAQSSMGNGVTIRLTGGMGKMGIFAVVAYGSIAVWGVVLYLLSPRLARWIVE